MTQSRLEVDSEPSKFEINSIPLHEESSPSFEFSNYAMNQLVLHIFPNL